jgi:serine/threonine protein kinase/beta-lactam-binding protein with PASTA domain
MNQEIPQSLANGRYTIGPEIGHGGMAEVHLGTDTRLGRQVAIKIMRSDFAEDRTFLARFRREAHSVAMLNNPNIVSIYDTGEEATEDATGTRHLVPYIVMEYVKGQTLRDILKENGPLSPRDAEQIMLGMLNALEYSHRMGIIHRDIKPGNIMISDQGVVKVMDFGIARALDDSATQMTKSQGVVGTAQYLSPEQARGETVDMRSDLYSAGCVLYEMLTGRPPFTGDSPVAIAYQHVSEIATPPSELVPGLPKVWDQVCAKAMAKDKQNRYSTAAEFKRDIMAVMNGGHVMAAGFNPIADFNGQKASSGAADSDENPGETTQSFNPLPPEIMPNGLPNGPADAQADTQAGQAPVATAEQSQSRAAQRARQQKRKKIIIWSCVAGAIALALLIWGIVTLVNRARVTTVSVPAITEEMSATRAEERITAAGLKFQRETDHNSSKPKGVVTRQTPPAGTKVPKGSTVTVWFSSGPASATVPNVKGMTQSEATARLRRAGFIVASTSTEDSATVEQDHVTRTDPAIASTQPKGTAIILFISTGRTSVPDVAGKSQDDAQKLLSDRGFSITVQPQANSKVAKGQAIGTNPAAGSTVDQKAMITLYISSGPDQVQLPGVSGAQTVGDAMNMLANRGVTVTLSNGTQSNYTNPTVKDQNGKDITNGGTVDKDSTVTISGTKPADNSGDGSGDNTDDNSNNGSDTGNATGTPPIPAPRQQ